MKIHPISCGWGIAFLIETTRGLFLIDSGSPDQQDRILTKMKELGRNDLKLIWITHAHYDHYGSASALRKITGVLIGVHADDAENMIAGLSPLGTTRRYGFIYPPAQKFLNFFRPLAPTSPDFVCEGGDTLEPYGLNASILHTPGHTPGHTCLKLEEGIVFAGDLLGGFPQPGLQRLLAINWDQLSNSLLTLQAAKPKWIYIGHSIQPISGEMIY
jgi:glyoxylase-like metal-dependent hydrolase (beta-lactamase superfamily II)